MRQRLFVCAPYIKKVSCSDTSYRYLYWMIALALFCDPGWERYHTHSRSASLAGSKNFRCTFFVLFAVSPDHAFFLFVSELFFSSSDTVFALKYRSIMGHTRTYDRLTKLLAIP